MEARLHFRVTNSAPVTAIVYHPLRREIVTGHEGQLKMINNSIRATPPISADGLIKCWEADTGKLSTILRKHQGWVSNLLYWCVVYYYFNVSDYINFMHL